MNTLTNILLPNTLSNNLIATNPDWTRADFNRAVIHLSGRLKTQNVQTAALWFEDAAFFACAVLAAWHAGVRVLLPPNLARDNVDWGNTADVWLTDAPHEKAFSDGLHANKVYSIPAMLSEMPSEITMPDNLLIPADAAACLKTSGSTGGAQIIVKTAAQMEAEALALAEAVPFGRDHPAVIGSVSPQHM